jgi:hypothetical protein
VTAPLESAKATEEEAQINVAVAAAIIHRDIKTSIGFGGLPIFFGAVRSFQAMNDWDGRNVPAVYFMLSVSCDVSSLFKAAAREGRCLVGLNIGNAVMAGLALPCAGHPRGVAAKLLALWTSVSSEAYD